ncbi:acyltransferase family protein [Chitinophaga varians]|uniref:acyltransferase family protein n=1 Tax=Chitinophaga varians TaxID=2202339 RepID=UPI00165EDF27|nr:acyltransferase [Chitinophaga varians]MBC9910577.1 acyltransferase [Chitinophaga varians]
MQIPSYFSGFNGLRAIAVILVLLFHGEILTSVTANGWIGVDLFFVISGFLITNILINQKGTDNFFINFYSRRSIRIFPLYYLVVIGVSVILFVSRSNEVADLPYYYLYLQNFKAATTEKYIVLLGHTWSLCVEEQFYLIWPLFIYMFPTKRAFYLTSGLILLSILIRQYFATHDYSIFYQSTLLPTRMDSLLIGAIIILYIKSFNNITIASLNKVSNIVGVFSIGALIMLTYYMGEDGAFIDRMASGYHRFGNDSLHLPYGHLKFTLLALLSGAVLTKLAFGTSHLSRKLCSILENPVLDSIGKISYGLYIYHWVIFYLFDSANRKLNLIAVTPVTVYLIFAIKVTITLVVAQCSWKYLEQPLNKLKERFQYQRQQKRSVTSAV